jgi:hypothetical protein
MAGVFSIMEQLLLLLAVFLVVLLYLVGAEFEVNGTIITSMIKFGLIIGNPLLQLSVKGSVILKSGFISRRKYSSVAYHISMDCLIFSIACTFPQ